MLTELYRKGGCLCQPAREGTLRCPLIIRPTSEDVITGQLIQVLKVLNPRWWLPDLLNHALGSQAFGRQVFRNLKIEPWMNKPTYPRELLLWDEGSTQVDVVITWENPPTTVYIEMKYCSELSSTTSRNHGQYGFAADQLSRNARVGLLECGYFRRPQLFEQEKRDFILLVVTPDGSQPLVARYRDPDQLRAAIPHSDQIADLPKLPFIGELSYLEIVMLMQRQRRWFSRSERIVIDQLIEYLNMKLSSRPKRTLQNKYGTIFESCSETPTGDTI
ncbi:MAG: hypothetical protein R3B84_15980 [Zavarzinella sp.]